MGSGFFIRETMNSETKVFFYVSDMSNRVVDGSGLWNTPLPSDRHYSTSQENSVITIGTYFQAAEIFFSDDDFSVTKDIVFKVKNERITSTDISRIDICLVKHGRFYHPAKVSIVANNEPVSVVLNLAIDEEGAVCMDREYPVLEKLRLKTDKIPAVYCRGRVEVEESLVFSMFVGEWFDDYHEFHISYDGDRKKIVVWDYEKGNYYLSEQDTKDLYREAAKIMSCCYSIETFEQIQPWHHAAGDFVLKKNSDGVDIRLITVRQHTSLFENSFDDADSLLEGALIFFISLSIRMRLDRVDGVGDTVWSDDIAVEAVFNGFIEGLESAESLPQFKSPFHVSFLNYIKSITNEDINDYLLMMIQSYHPDSPDVPVIMENIDKHVKLIETCFKNVSGKNEMTTT